MGFGSGFGWGILSGFGQAYGDYAQRSELEKRKKDYELWQNEHKIADFLILSGDADMAKQGESIKDLLNQSKGFKDYAKKRTFAGIPTVGEAITGANERLRREQEAARISWTTQHPPVATGTAPYFGTEQQVGAIPTVQPPVAGGGPPQAPSYMIEPTAGTSAGTPYMVGPSEGEQPRTLQIPVMPTELQRPPRQYKVDMTQGVIQTPESAGEEEDYRKLQMAGQMGELQMQLAERKRNEALARLDAMYARGELNSDMYQQLKAELITGGSYTYPPVARTTGMYTRSKWVGDPTDLDKQHEIQETRDGQYYMYTGRSGPTDRWTNWTDPYGVPHRILKSDYVPNPMKPGFDQPPGTWFHVSGQQMPLDFTPFEQAAAQGSGTAAPAPTTSKFGFPLAIPKPGEPIPAPVDKLAPTPEAATVSPLTSAVARGSEQWRQRKKGKVAAPTAPTKEEAPGVTSPVAAAPTVSAPLGKAAKPEQFASQHLMVDPAFEQGVHITEATLNPGPYIQAEIARTPAGDGKRLMMLQTAYDMATGVPTPRATIQLLSDAQHYLGSKGMIQLSPKEVGELRDAGVTIGLCTEMKGMLRQVAKGGLDGLISIPNAAETLQRLKMSASSFFAKTAFREAGVLTNQDITRASGLMPGWIATIGAGLNGEMAVQAMIKLEMLERFMRRTTNLFFSVRSGRLQFLNADPNGPGLPEEYWKRLEMDARKSLGLSVTGQTPLVAPGVLQNQLQLDEIYNRMRQQHQIGAP